jgi:signal peptidase
MRKFKIINWTVTGVAILALLIALAAIGAVITAKDGEAPKLLGVSLLRVVTGSMEPNIPEGSVILARDTDPNDLRIGDVISFYSSDPRLDRAINTHRIENIVESGGENFFVTKGDANPIPDVYSVTGGDILGKVVFHSTALGGVVRFAAGRFGFLLLVLIPLAAIVAVNLRDVIRLVRQEMRLADIEAKLTAKEEIEAAVRKEKKEKQAAARAAGREDPDDSDEDGEDEDDYDDDEDDEDDEDDDDGVTVQEYGPTGRDDPVAGLRAHERNDRSE